MKILRRFALFTCVSLAVLLSIPPARADAFEDANRAFAAGQYAESARGYAAVLKHDGYSAAVLFDLGNADLRLGKRGDAILNYERARWLAPHDPDIAANLRFARKQAGLAEESGTWVDNLADAFSPNGWGWLASGSLAVLCAGILALQFGSRYRHSLYLLNVLSALVLAAAGGAIAVRSQQLARAILPAKATPALISPFAGARTGVEFSAGEMVTVERAHGGFCFVRDFAGRTGWVDHTQVAMIVPAAS
jgi:tetratricopeptide (TPR) repeat protein